jgi:hypothetical protein
MATVTDSPAPPRTAVETRHWLILAAAVAASIGLRVLANTRFEAPTILTDELTYSLLARQFADGDISLSSGYGIVYPLLLAPSWAIGETGTQAYVLMQTTNAVLVSLTAIPIFLWARRMMQPTFALVAAVLTLLLPAMAYSGTIMTENAFVLTFTVAAFAIASAAERPTLFRQVLALGAIGLAFATRSQAVILLAGLPLVLLLSQLAEERATRVGSFSGVARRIARLWPTGAVIAIGLLAIAARSATSGWSPSRILQAYSAVTAGQYTPDAVARYAIWHLGDASLALGIVPLAALLVLLGMAILNRSSGPAERAYLATAVALTPLVIIQVAMFTSWFSQRVSERNMLCLFPLLLIGFALWLDRALPRPPRTTALAAAIAGGAVLTLPLAYLFGRTPSTETWALVAPEMLTRRLPGGVDGVQIALVIGVAAALLAFGLLRPRIALIALPVTIAAYFALSEAAIVHTVGKASAGYRSAPSVGEDADWLDRAVPAGAEVAFIRGSTLGPDADRIVLWQTSFFNRRPFGELVWGESLVGDPLTGEVTAPDGGPVTLPDYVIAPSSYRFAGEVVADRPAFTLTRPSIPYRLVFQTGGFYPDGWTGPSAAVSYHPPTNQRVVRIRLTRNGGPAGISPTTATVTAGPLAIRSDGAVGIVKPTTTETLEVPIHGATEAEVAIPASPFRVEITFATPFRFADFGIPDSRDLGGKVEVLLGSQVISR